MRYATFMTRTGIYGFYLESESLIGDLARACIELKLDSTDEALALRSVYEWPPGGVPMEIEHIVLPTVQEGGKDG